MLLATGPNPPQSVSLLKSSSTNTSLTFTWHAVDCANSDTCSSIRSYPYRLVNADTGMIMNGDTTGTSVTIRNLEPCVFYRFSVAATNDAKTTGLYGGEVNGTTTLAGNVRFLQFNSMLS